jgi:uncharacterized protein (DUF2141 family)
MFGKFFFLLFLLYPGNYPTNDNLTGNLLIDLDNIKTAQGIIWIGIYDSEENYMIKERAIVEGVNVTQTGKLQINIPDLQYGTYAIAIFHDINGNGLLDRNLIGIPSEPYAFSKKPKSKWRLPRFHEVKFDFTNSNQILNTKLAKWWD